MRVLYFSDGYTRYDRRFLARLAAAGHEVSYLMLDCTAVHEPSPIPERVQLLDYLDEPAAGDLARFAVETRADLVQAGSLCTCGWIAACAGVKPLAVTATETDFAAGLDDQAATRSRARKALDAADLLICDSQQTEDAAANLTDLRGKVIAHLPRGLDVDDIEGWPARVQGAHDGFTIVATRSWHPGHGIETLLKAFRLAREVFPKLRLILAGTGPLAPMVRDYCEVSGLSRAVEFPGRAGEAELPALFAQADLYLSCALDGGQFAPLLEALASGLPVLATDDVASREWIVEDVNGWLAPAEDATAFARALVRAATLPAEVRLEMGRLNRTLAFARADWNRNFEDVLAAYKDIRKARALEAS